eukprot:TRINITY_DN2301_c0_g1_i5.p1 TRINITY_DN2301_c0_g1~~TRINITY_DN2301_c0_g1_i5.p1  ORF type:complete len:254 (-),score=40.52 TRINITY_DN2301_c0_g1_i5:242-1003(-)
MDTSTLSTQCKGKLSFSSFQTPQMSLFSSSVLSTTTRAQNLLNKFRAAVPVVNIQNIIKQKPLLYMDKSLEHNFDELLQKGYSLVVSKKNEQISQKELQDHLNECNYVTEQEIIPEINKGVSLKESITHQQAIIENLKIDIDQLQYLINKTDQQINEKSNQVKEEHEQFVEAISQCQEANCEVKKSIQDNIVHHQLKRNQNENNVKVHQNQLEQLLKQLTELKGKCEQIKMEQGDRRRKIENKAKMYLGILNH